MPLWPDYALSDLLLFAPETYWRLFERMNASVWPLQIPLIAASIGLVLVCMRPWRHASQAVALGLAIGWGMAAQIFLAAHYQPINWAVAWVIPAIWAQVALSIFLVPGLRFDVDRTSVPGLGLTALAILYPLLGLTFSRPLMQAEVALLAPDPTAILALGLIGLARPGWRRLVLSIIPMVWCIVSAVTLLTMEQPIGWVLIGAVLCAVAHLAFAVRLRAIGPRG